MKMMRSVVAVAVAMLGAGCGGSGSSGTGKVTVLLKDAPGELAAAVVTITEVDLMGSGGMKVLRTEPVTTDLLTLANDTAKLAEGVEVESGTYTQLRFVLSGGYVQTMDGTIYASSPDYAGLPAGAQVGGTLRMPSMMQSGLKIDLPGGAVEVTSDGSPTTILVDFNVAQSFGHDAGSSGAWVMHPVCHASRFELAGSIDVALSLAAGVTLPGTAKLTDFAAVLTPDAGGDPVTASLVETTAGVASATFRYLAPGSYGVTFTAPGITFTTTPAVPATVTVSSGQATPAAFVITAASQTPTPATPAP